MKPTPWVKVILISLVVGFALQAVASFIPYTHKQVRVAITDPLNISTVEIQTTFHIGYPAYAFSYPNPDNQEFCSISQHSLKNFLYNLLLWNGLAFLLTFALIRRQLLHKREQPAGTESGVKPSSSARRMLLSVAAYGVIVCLYWEVIQFVFMPFSCGEI